MYIWARTWVQSSWSVMRSMFSYVCCRWSRFLCCWPSLEKARRHCEGMQPEILRAGLQQNPNAVQHPSLKVPGTTKRHAEIREGALSPVTWANNHLSAQQLYPSSPLSKYTWDWWQWAKTLGKSFRKGRQKLSSWHLHRIFPVWICR